MSEDITNIELSNTREVSYGRVATAKLFKQHDKDGTEDINKWREIFVSQLDPTEYRGGVALLGSWSEWERFKRNWPSFQKLYLNTWLDEIEIRLKSLAIHSLSQDAIKGGTAAARFLAEGKYKERKAGRPTKVDIKRQANIAVELEKRIANDLERIGGLN